MSKNIPTMYGLQAAVNAAQELYDKAMETRGEDLEEFMQAKEVLRKARENLRIFTYKQKGRITPNGRMLRA